MKLSMNVTKQEVMDKIDVCVGLLCERGQLTPGSLLVLGCSTSEMTGGTIGQSSVPEAGQWAAEAMLKACDLRGMIASFQCCEHLNRTVVMPLPALQDRQYTRVCAVPKPKAGGSTAAAAWLMMERPALAEIIHADAGLDIGQTLIGMHIKRVAVPLRAPFDCIGHAHITLAFSRPPLIGGSRAQYE